MNKLLFVLLNRVEGPKAECQSVVFCHKDSQEAPAPIGRFANAQLVHTNEIATEVLVQLAKWGISAPEGGGYDKIDFLVQWENGHSYGGRFDLQRGGCDRGQSFWVNLKNNLGLFALLRRPISMTDSQWDDFCERISRYDTGRSAAAILSACELPACDVPTECAS